MGKLANHARRSLNNMRVLATVSVSALIGSGAAIAQVPVLDQSTLNGKFNFIYGVYQRSNSTVVTGTLSFDGQRQYTVVTGSATAQGSYRVNLDGTGSLSNWVDPTLPPLSLRVAAGVALVGASTVEQSTADQHDLLLAIPAATKAPTMSGPWGGVSFLYTPDRRSSLAPANSGLCSMGAETSILRLGPIIKAT